MWQLGAEQTQALQALQRARDLQRLGLALGEAFPAVRERVGTRYGELIQLGAERGGAHGLNHLLALARYLACWFVLGAEFEARESYAWAHAILGDAQRSEGAKVFQLCRRCREELARPGVASIDGPTFDAALAALDATLARAGALASLHPRQRLTLGSACDIDAVDLRLREGSAPPQRYRVEQGQLRREPLAAEPAAVTRVVGTETAGPLPPVLHLLAPPRAPTPQRLRLRVRCAQTCDAEVHPVVSHATQTGRLEWRGILASDLSMDLRCADAAPPQPTDPMAPQPVLALEAVATDSLVHLEACGLRDSGAPLGEQGRLQTQLSVWPDTQHMMLWQRQPLPELHWPEIALGRETPTLPDPRVRIERDGQVLDASRWLQGLKALDQQLLKGLGELALAWERESGVSQGRLVAEPKLLCGTAAFTWGFAPAAKAPLVAPYLRTAAWLDLVACQLSLRLSGSLALQGSLSQLQLHVAAAQPLQAQWDRGPADDDSSVTVGAASFSQPFVLGLEAVAQPDLAMVDVVGPVHGALVGSCGLRLRPDGVGLQWFMHLAIEPVSVPLRLHDPLLGQQQRLHPLLPAMTLVDWSLG